MTHKPWMVIALMSLAVNLFGISFLAGHWTGSRSTPIGALSAEIPYPAAIRRQIVAELLSEPGAALEAFQTLHKRRAEMLDAQRAAVVDPAKIAATQAAVREATSRLQALAQVAVARAVEKATPEERAAIDQQMVFDLPELKAVLGSDE